MSDEEQPSWLNANNSAAAAPEPSAPARSASSAKPAGSGDAPYKGVVKTVLLILNLGFMIFLAATGALGIGNAGSSGNINESGVVFVGIYMILFAAIVFIFEISQVIPSQALDMIFKKNFGFLYGQIGKGLFITFMGVLAFGLSTPRQLAIACGVLVAAWGPLQICIYLKFPQYFDIKEKYEPGH